MDKKNVIKPQLTLQIMNCVHILRDVMFIHLYVKWQTNNVVYSTPADIFLIVDLHFQKNDAEKPCIIS